jgi:hypothetical protein
MIPTRIKRQANRNIRAAGKATIALLPKDAEPHYIIALANAPNSV